MRLLHLFWLAVLRAWHSSSIYASVTPILEHVEIRYVSSKTGRYWYATSNVRYEDVGALIARIDAIPLGGRLPFNSGKRVVLIPGYLVPKIRRDLAEIRDAWTIVQ